jgi:hypothetical protein
VTSYILHTRGLHLLHPFPLKVESNPAAKPEKSAHYGTSEFLTMVRVHLPPGLNTYSKISIRYYFFFLREVSLGYRHNAKVPWVVSLLALVYFCLEWKPGFDPGFPLHTKTIYLVTVMDTGQWALWTFSVENSQIFLSLFLSSRYWNTYVKNDKIQAEVFANFQSFSIICHREVTLSQSIGKTYLCLNVHIAEPLDHVFLGCEPTYVGSRWQDQIFLITSIPYTTVPA